MSRDLARRLPSLDEPSQAAARAFLASRSQLYARFAPLIGLRMGCARTRHHGDLRLEKWLSTGKDWVVVDFTGDRDRPLTERRRKHSPLRDVAAMVGSLQELARTELADPGAVRETDREAAEAWAAEWLAWTSAGLLAAWLAAADGAPFVPREPEVLRVLLDVSMIERQLAALGRRLVEGSKDVSACLAGLAPYLT